YNYLLFQGHEPVPAKDPYDIRIDKSSVTVDPCIHEVKLIADISNNGTLDVTEYVLALRDQDGHILGSKEISQIIPPGTQITETMLLTDMPDNFKQNVTVEVQLVHDGETRMLNNYEKI